MRVLSELGKHCHPHLVFQFSDDRLVTSWTTFPSLSIFLSSHFLHFQSKCSYCFYFSFILGNEKPPGYVWAASHSYNLSWTLSSEARGCFRFISFSSFYISFLSWKVDHEAIDFTESVSFPSSVLPFLYHIQAGFLKSVF